MCRLNAYCRACMQVMQQAASGYAETKRLRALKVYSSRVFEVCSESASIDDIDTSYWQLRVEPVAPDDLATADMCTREGVMLRSLLAGNVMYRMQVHCIILPVLRCNTVHHAEFVTIIGAPEDGQSHMVWWACMTASFLNVCRLHCVLPSRTGVHDACTQDTVLFVVVFCCYESSHPPVMTLAACVCMQAWSACLRSSHTVMFSRRAYTTMVILSCCSCIPASPWKVPLTGGSPQCTLMMPPQS